MYARAGAGVNISTVHGLRASPFKSAYVAAKHGLEGLSKMIALEGGHARRHVQHDLPRVRAHALVEKQIADQARVHGIPESEVIEKIMLTEPAVKRLVEPAEVAEPGRPAVQPEDVLRQRRLLPARRRLDSAMTQPQGGRKPLMDSAEWYASLPGFTASGAALLTDESGAVLVVKPWYRDHWLLPGGVTEAGSRRASALNARPQRRSASPSPRRHCLPCTGCHPPARAGRPSRSSSTAVPWPGRVRCTFRQRN